jgi:hypothetical protein
MSSEKVTPIQSYINDLGQFITGENFWQASLYMQLEGLSVEQAMYKPAPERHCIWELVRHIAYWKHWAVTYVNEGTKLDAKADNWRALPEVQSEDNWQADVNMLKSLHVECVKIANKVGNEIFESTDEKYVFFRQLLYHDCYHTGQIGLLRVIQGLKPAGFVAESN